MFIFPTLLSSIAFSAVSPLHDSPASAPAILSTRDNDWNLSCGNSGNNGDSGVTAGSKLLSYLQNWPKLGQSFRESGSDQAWLRYLMCTPDTRTYTFFNMGSMEAKSGETLPSRQVGSALLHARDEVRDYLAVNSDGPIANGQWSTTPASDNVEIYVQNSKGKMTYGVLGAALSGLSEWMALGYNYQQEPMVFQINDGDWGELGVGYAGFVNPNSGKCMYASWRGVNFSCEDVKKGKVIPPG